MNRPAAPRPRHLHRARRCARSRASRRPSARCAARSTPRTTTAARPRMPELEREVERRRAVVRRAPLGGARAPRGRGGDRSRRVLARRDVEAHRRHRRRPAREHRSSRSSSSSSSSPSAAGRRSGRRRRSPTVESGTPAAAAGLQAGDRIVAVNGRPATTFDSVSHRHPGEPRQARSRSRSMRGGRRGDGRPAAHDPRSAAAGSSASSPTAKLVPVLRSARAAARQPRSDLWGVVTGTGDRVRRALSTPRAAASSPARSGSSRVSQQQLQVGLTLLPRDPRLREHVARAAQPAAAAAARRRPHPLLAHRGASAAARSPARSTSASRSSGSRSSCSSCSSRSRTTFGPRAALSRLRLSVL